jgi:hypothetical protein
VLLIRFCFYQCFAFDFDLTGPVNHDIIWRAGDGYGGEYHDVDKP